MSGIKIICPKCNSTEFSKAGIIKTKQRYRCKACRYHYMLFNAGNENWKRNAKRKAIIFYLEGFTLRYIGKMLDIHHGTVKNWIIQSGLNNKSFRNSIKPEIIECEFSEMADTIKKKCMKAEKWLLVALTKNAMETYLLQTNKSGLY